MRTTLPHFIGIGGLHTGLTTILPLITAHPAVSSTMPNTNFFTRPHTDAELGAYTEQFQEVGKLLVGECSPAYLTHPAAAERISVACPDTKLFAVINHPLQRLVEEWRRGETGKPRTRRCYEYASANQTALARGLYGTALTQYFSYYSPLQLHVIVYEDFLADPLAVMRSVYEFLGVQKDFVPLALSAYVPPTEEPKVKPFIVKRVLAWGPKRLKAYRDAKAQLVLTPPPPVHRFFTPEELQALVSYYEADVAVANNLLGRNLTAVWE